MGAVRILVVDDHDLVRDGIAGLLRTQFDLVVVGEAASGEEALHRARELLPDVILMDIQMPGMDGITAARLITKEMPCTKVLMLTASEDHLDFHRSVESGAKGHLHKNVSADGLFASIRQVQRGFAPESSGNEGQVFREAPWTTTTERSSPQGLTGVAEADDPDKEKTGTAEGAAEG